MIRPARDQAGPRANRRSAARLAAVQALYQMDVAGADLMTTLAEFEAHRIGEDTDGHSLVVADIVFFRDLVAGVVKVQRRIDRIVQDNLVPGWPLSRLDLTLRATLRAGTYELALRRDVPPKVVISEYVDVARAFFDDGEEPRMVNAVLDGVARKERVDELGTGRNA